MQTHAPSIDEIRAAWDALAPRYDAYTTPEDMPFADHALDRLEIGPGTRFLDVACGSGAVAIPAARRGADVTGVDLAPTMIERLLARARSEGLTRIEGRVMRAEALDLPDDTFDVAASQNGVSLLPDVQEGLRELVRVTKPGGQVCILAFGAPERVEFLGFFMGALQAVDPGFTPMPLDPPPPPMQLADPNRFRRVLAEAGLRDVEVEPATWEWRCPSGRHFWNVVSSSNPIAVQLASGLTDEQLAEVQHVLDGMLRERAAGDAAATLHIAMQVGIGTK